jgi:hypothetical protein
MHFIAQPISHQRLQRFHRWAMLWLKWFAAFLDAAAGAAPLSQQAQAIGHRWLDGVERLIVDIVILRAARRVRPCNKPCEFSEHRQKQTGFRRAVIGSAMRRALRPKDLRRRIEALSQSIEALVERVLRRLPCGLTRRRPIAPRREQRAPALRQQSVFSAPLADTS